MEIQSLSVVVPGGCPNRCKFCVTQLHPNSEYKNQIEKNWQFRHLYKEDYMRRTRKEKSPNKNAKGLQALTKTA